MLILHVRIFKNKLFFYRSTDSANEEPEPEQKDHLKQQYDIFLRAFILNVLPYYLRYNGDFNKMFVHLLRFVEPKKAAILKKKKLQMQRPKCQQSKSQKK